MTLAGCKNSPWKIARTLYIFEVLTVVIKIQVFWDVTSCKLINKLMTFRMSIAPSLSVSKQSWASSCLHRTSLVSKTLTIVPTDAHYYKIMEMLTHLLPDIYIPRGLIIHA